MEMEKILERINSINWNSQIQAEKFKSAFSFEIIHNKQKILKKRKILDFEDFLSKEKNRLTIFLHHKDITSYWKWNEIALQYKLRIESLKLISKKNEFTAILKNLEMILLMTMMEEHYRLIHKKTPVFFIELLAFLENGYIPCGWNGEIIDDELNKFDFKSGKLIVLPIYCLFDN